MEDEQTAMRLAAFKHVREMNALKGDLTTDDLRAGFQFQGERIPLTNPQRGIFKPQRMQHLLSIKTVFPTHARRVWYDDQRDIMRNIFDEPEEVDYSFMGDDPENADNQWLREACEQKIPIIYFIGIAPKIYQAMIPAYISNWDRHALKARVRFGIYDLKKNKVSPLEAVPERRHVMREVKHRCHQSMFRQMILTAYKRRCALSGLPAANLLDAAHIISDTDENFGQPEASNGLLLSKIHHAAFDAQLIGIDADYQVHVSEELLSQNDGPMLESLKKLDHKKLILPNRMRKCDRPDKDRLAMRFEEFQSRSG